MDKTIILVQRGNVKKIAEAFGVTRGMVSKTLRGHRMSELSKKIRHVALTQYGGMEMKPIKKTNLK